MSHPIVMMVCMQTLADFEMEMAGLTDDLAVLSPLAERLLLQSEEARRQIEASQARLVAILDRHVEAGTGPAPEEVFAATGCSTHAARAAAARARILNDLHASLDNNDTDNNETAGNETAGNAHGDRDAHAGGPEDPYGSFGFGAGGPADPFEAASGEGAGAGGEDDGSTDLGSDHDRPSPPPINPENLDAIRRAAAQFNTDEERAAFAKRQPELARLAATLSVKDFAARLKKIVFAVVSELGLTIKERQRKASSLKKWTDKDGMLNVFAKFDPERGGTVASAIDREMQTEAQQASNAEGITLPFDDNLAASALFRICDRAFDPNRKASRPLVGLLVDAKTLRDGEHDASVSEMMGTADWVDGATRRRWLCDCDLQRVVVNDAGEPINVGRRYRTATPAQRLAMRALYRTCAFPGCDCQFDWCQLHHVDFWEVGGPTDLDNLVPLCSRHHHLVHEGGWSLRLEPGRIVVVLRPDGSFHARSSPDGPIRRPNDGCEPCPRPPAQHPRDADRATRRTESAGPGHRAALFDEREPVNN